MVKVSLITGITGQDGSYLAELLLEKNYIVWGIIRRASDINTKRIDHLYKNKNLILRYGDMTDSSNILHILYEIKNSTENLERLEIYNLAAMSHVKVSFEMPEYTGNVDGLGTLRILEAIRSIGIKDKTRFYQASTSELYGKVQEVPQKETTPFYPRSPYGVAKLYGFWITKNYREAYNMFACNGILFNHESPRRGPTFVTRKITRGLNMILTGERDKLVMGNIDSLRDWGHAKDYVKMQWLMLQQDKPEDFVIATGKQYTVREFINWTASEIGIKLVWKNSGIDEIAIIDEILLGEEEIHGMKIGDTIVKVDPKYFRPTEVETLLGDPSKAKKKLGWEPEISAQEMCAEMVSEDLIKAKQNALLKKHGFEINLNSE